VGVAYLALFNTSGLYLQLQALVFIHTWMNRINQDVSGCNWEKWTNLVLMPSLHLQRMVVGLRYSTDWKNIAYIQCIELRYWEWELRFTCATHACPFWNLVMLTFDFFDLKSWPHWTRLRSLCACTTFGRSCVKTYKQTAVIPLYHVYSYLTGQRLIELRSHKHVL